MTNEHACTVSIIIPAYNSSKYIERTLESVHNQIFLDYEAIIIDDCSTDNTQDLIKHFIKDKNKFRLIKNTKNMGAGLTRNVGIENSKGKYIAFLDADDEWMSSKLLEQVNFMKAGNYPISHTSYAFIDEDGVQRDGFVTASKKVNLSTYLKTTQIGMSTAMIDKSQIGDFRLASIRTRQDTKLWIDLLDRGFISHGINKTLVNYRVRKNQISGNKIKMLARTYSVFSTVKSLNWLHVRWCFLCYAFNGIIKRTNLKKSNAIRSNP